MPSFLKDIKRFYGTKEKDGKGQTLEQFLESYEAGKYETPSCTTDAVVFAYGKKLTEKLEDLKLLLIRRGNHPSLGCLALPGGFADMREDLDVTARRELEEETGVTGLAMEQLAVYGNVDRDPRTRVITTAYMALVKEEDVSVKAGDDATDAMWCSIQLYCLERQEKKSEGGIWDVSKYRLRIVNEEKGIVTEAVVEEQIRQGLVREHYYQVKDGGMIATDHAAIIVQAIRRLQHRLREQEVHE